MMELIKKWGIILFALLASLNAFAQKGRRIKTNTYGVCVVLTSGNTCSISCWDEKRKEWGYDYVGKVIIPSSIEFEGKTYTVTSIDRKAFADCTYMMSVELPNTITSIGEQAFAGCFNLKSVNIPESVSVIGNKAFYECESLTSLHIPNTVSFIGSKAFYGCTGLYPIESPNNANFIGRYAFGNSPEKDIVKEGKRALDNKNLVQQAKTKSQDKDDSNKKKVVEQVAQPTIQRKQFPNINITEVMFIDDGNNIIDANEQCRVKITVANLGKGDAIGCVAKANIENAAGLTAKDVMLPNILSGHTIDVELNLIANDQIKDGNANITVQVDEPNGFGSDPMCLTVETKAFTEPRVLISDYSVTGVQGGVLAKRVPFDLQILVQNASHGKADDVDISISVPQNVIITEGEQHARVNRLNGGETMSMTYSLIANNNYTSATIPIQFSIKEKYGKYAESKTINLMLNQAQAHNTIEVKGNAGIQQGDIEIATIKGGTKQSDVDFIIPENAMPNENTFAVVIANEKYRRESAVRFAANDGNVVRQYLTKTLGVPNDNVKMVEDATFNEMREKIDWLRKVAEAYHEANIIVYYAGHGMPDEGTGMSYLIPSDGNSANPASCIALSELYEDLANMNAKRVCVFLDACFSGAQRGDGMLMAARGVAIKPKNEVLKGNLVVFSAAQGTETAYPYTEMGHGLFTYFMLKALQTSQGNMSLGELGEYISTEVYRRSIVVNGKSQTPTTVVSATLGDEWKKWTLK